MAKDGVGGEVVGGVDEMCVGGWGFSGAADSGLGVGDDAVIDVDEASLNEWGEAENDGGGVAAGVGDEAGVADFVAVQFGTAVDGLGLQPGCSCGIGVLEFIDGAVDVVP